MIDQRFHNNVSAFKKILYDHFDKPYFDPDKPRIKDIIWNHYDWIEKTYEVGRLRDTVLDNVQRTLLCKTVYLGYDAFNCTHCDNWIWLFRHCHSSFCSSCGVKCQKQPAVKAEVMCIDVKHRHIVFTIPEEYREIFRKDRDLLDEVHRLLGNEKKAYRNRQKRKEELKAKLDRLKFRTLLADIYNRDIFKCECGNNFYFVFAYDPLEGRTNDRQY